MENNFKYHFIAPHHETLALSVYNCGFQQCDPLFSWGPALRNHHLIHFVAKGCGRFVCNSKEYNLSAGEGFFAPANQTIFYEADENSPWEYYWVGFSGVDAGRLLKACGLSAESPCFSCGDLEKVKELILDIYNSNGNSIENEAEMTGDLYRFFSHLMRETNAESKRISRSAEYIDAAIRYIEHNYSHPISVNDIASSAAISRSHLYRIFVQELGMTPNDYLTRYRISIACDLLRINNISISEVAFSSGFSDPLYFSRVFKRVTGTTPSSYAQSSNAE